MLSAASNVVLAADAAPNPWFDPSWVTDNWSTIVPLVGQHVRLTVVSVVIGALIAFPLALVARRSRGLAAGVLGLSTFVYTIPSLAMFAFIAPFTGLSETTVGIGLVLYSLVVLVRNFLAGLQAVPAEVREAARGMGYGSGRMLLRVELPLAVPSIMTGINQTIMMSLSMVVVAALIAAKGLGEDVLFALQHVEHGKGLSAGGAIALCAMMMDRVVQGTRGRT